MQIILGETPTVKMADRSIVSQFEFGPPDGSERLRLDVIQRLLVIFIKGPLPVVVLSSLYAGALGYWSVSYLRVVGWSVFWTIAFVIWSKSSFKYAFSQTALTFTEKALLVMAVTVQMGLMITTANLAVFYLVKEISN